MSGTNEQKPCPQKPCASKQFDPQKPNQHTEEGANAEVKGRPILYTGVIWIGILRRFLIPRPPCSNDSGSPGSPVPRSVSHMPAAARPVDSVLKQPPATTTAIINKLPERSKDDEWRQSRRREGSHSPLAALLSQIQEAAEQVRQVSGDVSALLRDGKETTSETLSELRREEAEAYRWCVVSSGALGGYLAGLRRSVLPRLVYSLTTATAAAAICYPQEAKHFNAQGLAVVHQWIVYGLKFLQERPQKPLGVADSKRSSSKEKSHFETQEPKKETKTTLNAATLYKKHFGTSGNHYAKLNQKSIIVDSRPEKGELPEDKTFPNYSEVSHRGLQDNNHPSSTSRQGRKLSLQCDKDGMATLPSNSLPYSPALPVPIQPGKNYTLQSHEDPQEEKVLEEIVAKSSLHKNNLNDSISLQDEEAENHSLDEATFDNSSNLDSGFNPSNLEPGVVMEDKGDTFKYEISDEILSQQHPLNKKLSQYYGKSPENTLASVEIGYDDLYSNRK